MIAEDLGREVEVDIKTRKRRKGHGNQGVGADSEKNTEGEDQSAKADRHIEKGAGPDQDLGREAKVGKDL